MVGVSDGVPTDPSHFDAAKIDQCVLDIRCDLRDFEKFRNIVKEQRPEFVFHLAAQSLVGESLRDPVGTYATNVLGTVHMLQALTEIDNPCVAILVTSDKSYENREWQRGYKEDDRLGGTDPYSASKGAAEFAIRAYVESVFSKYSPTVRIGIGRAGNVIGGGDWAPGRIVPDCVRSWIEDRDVEIRNSLSTRPWQHVLEPLSGYLYLAAKLQDNIDLHGEPFNFGPSGEQGHTVIELVQEMSEQWGQACWNIIERDETAHEAKLLKLNCEKANRLLGWRAVLTFQETIDRNSPCDLFEQIPNSRSSD